MSDQEIADRLAKAAGFVLRRCECAICRVASSSGRLLWFRESLRQSTHPFPVGDVNAVLAAWPEGWEWQRISRLAWEAWRGSAGRDLVKTTDTGNIWHDLALLTAMVLEREAGR